MAEWEDRLANHRVWNELESLKKSLSSARIEAKDAEAGDSVYLRLDRLMEVEQHVRHVLDAADPRLAPTNSLDGVADQLNRARGQIDNYTQNHNAGHLQSADGHADKALQHLTQLWFPGSAEDLEGLRKRLTSFRRSAGQLAAYAKSDLRDARKQVQKLQQRLEKRLSEIDETAEQKRQEIERKYAEQLGQLEETIKQHRDEIQAQKQRLESAISEHQSQFSEAQETRRQSFAEEQTNRKDAFEDLVADLEQQVTGTLKTAKSRVDNVFDSVKAVEEEVRESAGAIGAIGLTEAFKETADTERKTARFWRGVAAFSLLVLIGAAFWVFESTGQSTEWIALARKGSLTLPLLIMAGYSARQAARHFNNAQKHRQMQVELTSLGPYIANLDKDQQAAIKDRLVDRWFGQQWEPSEGDSEISGASNAALRELRQLVQEVMKGMTGRG